jgi:hypothetical protein
MSALTAAFQILAGVIAVGGAAKLVAPDGFSSLLRTLGLPSGRPLARASGVVEVALGATAIVVGGTVAAALVAVAYAVFAVVVLLARRAGAESCGCFGAATAPPSAVHVVVNGVSAVVAAAAAVAGPESLMDSLVDQPLLGVPYLALVTLAVWLTVVLDTTGARLVDEMAAVAGLGQTFRDNAAATAPSRSSHDHGHDHRLIDISRNGRN